MGMSSLRLPVDQRRRLPAGGAAFNPLLLGTPDRWYRGSAGLLDAASNPITVDGTAIGTVQDQTGNGKHGTQITPSNRATYSATGLGGGPAIKFDGVAATFFDMPTMAAFTAATAILVIKLPADPPASSQKSGLWIIGTNPTSHFPFTDGTIYDDFGSTVRKTTVNPTPSLTAAHVYSVRSQANAWNSRLDGSTLFTTATNTTGFSATPVIGRSSVGAACDGWIAEFFVWSSYLSDADLSTAEHGFGDLHGITVT